MRTRSTRGPVALLGTAFVTTALTAGVASDAAAQQTCDLLHRRAVMLQSGGKPDVLAQTGYIPYYGKNKIRYNNFRWHIYTTDHFEIYYYPEIEQHLERITSYAESAYQQISSDLKHDLATKVPMVLFKTQSEFQQQNIE